MSEIHIIIDNNEIKGFTVDENVIKSFDTKKAPKDFTRENWHEWYLENEKIIHDKERYESEQEEINEED